MSSRKRGPRGFIHGETAHRSPSAEYRIWIQMIGRCSTPSHRRFADYGGRGIKVCDRWMASLAHFIDDMGRRPSPQHTLDRIDNSGPYAPENCRWATRAEQMRNTRRTVFLEFRGRRMSMVDWALEAGIGYSTLRRRIQVHGWSVERALTEPATVGARPKHGRVVIA